MRGRAASRVGSRYPNGWERSTADVETVLLTLPPDVTRVTASMRLSIEAEFGGWELSRVRKYSDGTRKVLLKRKRPRGNDSPPPDSRTHDSRTHDNDPRENGAQAC